MKCYFWTITLLANVLIATSSNVERPKRDLAFIKKIIGNLFGYNTNYKIPYPVPNYQFLSNVMPDPYINRNVYQGSIPKILLPNNMVMSVITYRKPNLPHITAFGQRNYKTEYAYFEPPQLYGNMQRIISIPSYNKIVVPLVSIVEFRCDDKNPVLYTKHFLKDKYREGSIALSKQEPQKLQELQSFRKSDENTNEFKSKVTSQSPISEVIAETPTTSRIPVKKNQRIKTSTISPSLAINEVETNISSAPTTSATELLQKSTSSLPSFTNEQGLITSYAVRTLTTSTLPLSLPVKNFGKFETSQLIDEEIKSTSMRSIPMTIDDYNKLNNKDDINNDIYNTKKLLQMTTSTPPTFTTAQDLLTSHVMSSTFATSGPLSLVSIINIKKLKKGETIISTANKIDEEINSTSTENTPPKISDYKQPVNKEENNNKLNNTSKKLIETSSLMPPTFTDAQRLITLDTMRSTSITSLPLLEASVKNVEKKNIKVEPTIPTSKKIDEELKSISTESTLSTIISEYKQTDNKDEITNKINPKNTSEKLIETSTLTPPTFTNAQEFLTSDAVTLGSTLTTSLPPSPLPRPTYLPTVEKLVTKQPNISSFQIMVEEIKPTSTKTSTIPDIYTQSNKFKSRNTSNTIVTFTEPIRTRFVYKNVNSNKPNEDTVFKMENIEYLNAGESQGDMVAQPSIFNHAIDVLNSIAPIRGKVLQRPNIYIPQDKIYTEDTLEDRYSNDMEIFNPSTDVYPSESKELDYLRSYPVILDDPSYSFVENISENESNESDDGLRWSTTSDSDRDIIPRGDIPDV